MKEKEIPLEERIEQIFESGWVNEFNYLEQLMQETRSCLYNLQQELQRKDNIINELKQNKRDYERENILEMKLHILDDNWNELKKWLDIKEEKETVGTFSDVLDKIKELESK